jgi:hypothetical protein
MSAAISAFHWQGQPSIFMAEAKFTSTAKAVATNAKKLGTGMIDLPAGDSINTEAADRLVKPKSKARALT